MSTSLRIKRRARFALLCGALSLWAVPVLGQEGPGEPPGEAERVDVEIGQPEPGENPAERATDLREAINENLVQTMGEEQAEPEEVPTAPAEDGDEEEEWYDRFQTVTGFLQSMPDRVPVLRGRNWVHFGRFEIEYGHFSGGVLKDESGFNFRSLRGGIIRRFSDRTTVKLEIDVTDGDSNWTDLWARFNTRLGVFTVGNHLIAQTLVNQTSRLSRTFMEVALPADAFGLGRRLGAGWDFHLRDVGVHLTAFGQDLNDSVGDFGYGGRFYYNPTNTPFSMFHIGASAVREKMDSDARFRAWPESRVTDIRLVNTGLHPDVDNQTIYGVELAGARDSYSVRSEYFVAEWDRPGLTDPRFDGFYVQANWAATGEAFHYSQGKFLRIRPESSRGAWEVAARYSRINLNDKDISGGKQSNVSLILSWYAPGNQFRVQSSLIHYDTDANAGNENDFIAQVRTQFNW